MSVIDETRVDTSPVGIGDGDGDGDGDGRRVADDRHHRALNAGAIVGRIVRRLLGGILVVFAAVTLAYIALQLAPGDFVDLLIGPDTDPTPEVIAAVTAKWGLDKPPIEQYINYLWNLLHGDFGTSYIYRKDVADLIGSQIWHTVALAATALVIAIVLALALALLTAGRLRSTRIVRFVELVFIATPGFWLGLLLILLFSYRLGWLPSGGADSPLALILPALTMAVGLGSFLAQILREGLERARSEPFAMSVRARGVSELALTYRHALRHAALPVITILGWVIAGMLGGAAIIETLFSRPGLGQIAAGAVLLSDVPVVLAVVIIATVAYVVASTLVDILYIFIDPRVRFSRLNGE